MVLVDNFGIMLAGIMRPPQSSVSAVKTMMVDNGGVTRSFDMYSPGAGFFRSGSTRVQIGDDDTPVTRLDFSVAGAFSNAPENAPVVSNAWGITPPAEQTQGQTNINNVQENGTVREVGLFKNATDNTAALRLILLSRNIVLDQSFLIGENVITENTFVLA